MKKQIIKSFDKILTMLLAAIGCGTIFGSCESQVCEYGSPHANYAIKGTITTPNGKPVKGIKVKALYINPYQELDSTKQEYLDGSYAFSDGKGQYYLQGAGHLLTITDVDGTDNEGLFAPDTIKVPPFTEADSIPDTNSDNWDWYGNFEKTIDITLTKQETPEE